MRPGGCGQPANPRSEVFAAAPPVWGRVDEVRSLALRLAVSIEMAFEHRGK